MVIIFCGVPGSGKSTIAKKLAKELKKLGSFQLFISDKVVRGVYKKISQFTKDNLGKFNFILIDATFYKKKWREMVKKITKKKKERVFTIYLHCSLKTSLLRNKKRKPHIPESAVHIIYHQIEKPKKPDIFIDTDKIKPKTAVLKIIKKLKKKI